MSWRDRCIWAIMPGHTDGGFTALSVFNGAHREVNAVGAGPKRFVGDQNGNLGTTVFAPIERNWKWLGPVRVADFDQDSASQHVRLINTDRNGGLDFSKVSNHFTIASIFKPRGNGVPPSSSSDPRIYSQDQGSAVNDHDLMIGIANSGLRARMRVRMGTITETILTDVDCINSNEIQMIAGRVTAQGATTYRGEVLHIAEDGTRTEKLGSTTASTYNPRTGLDIAIGANAGTNDNAFHGEILIIAAWDYALSNDELHQWFYSPFEIYQPREIVLPTDVTGEAGGDTEVNANTATLTLTEYPASIANDINVAATTAGLTLNELAATIAVDIDVQATAAGLTLTEYAASIGIDRNIAATLATLNLQTYAAEVALGFNIEAALALLTLETKVAVINSTNVIITDVNTTESWEDGTNGLVATGSGFC